MYMYLCIYTCTYTSVSYVQRHIPYLFFNTIYNHCFHAERFLFSLMFTSPHLMSHMMKLISNGNWQSSLEDACVLIRIPLGLLVIPHQQQWRQSLLPCTCRNKQYNRFSLYGSGHKGVALLLPGFAFNKEHVLNTEDVTQDTWTMNM